MLLAARYIPGGGERGLAKFYGKIELTDTDGRGDFGAYYDAMGEFIFK